MSRKDETYYWDTVCFSGYLFQLPRVQFTLGSGYFEAQYLQISCDAANVTAADSGGIITLDGVTANEFRIFLKLLFPVYSISTTLELSKDEWLTILALSTRWYFLAFRQLAIQHLDPQLSDAIDLVRVGRSAYVPKWVMRGYQALVRKDEAITEEESGIIGHLATVKLYIIRHSLQGFSYETPEFLEQLLSQFAEEWEDLSREDTQRCIENDIVWDKNQVGELQRLKEEVEKRRKEDEERQERLAEEEQRRLVREEGKRWSEEAQKRKVQQEEYERRLTEEKVRAAKREDALRESHRISLEESRRREEDHRLQHAQALKKLSEAYSKVVKELSHYREKDASLLEAQGATSPRPQALPTWLRH